MIMRLASSFSLQSKKAGLTSYEPRVATMGQRNSRGEAPGGAMRDRRHESARDIRTRENRGPAKRRDDAVSSAPAWAVKLAKSFVAVATVAGVVV